jgi:hypothetical protein
VPKRIALTAGWIAALAAAATIGVATVGALRGGSDDPPLSQEQVNNALAGPSSRKPADSAASEPSPSAQTSSSVRKYISSPGGTLWASCTGDLATLSSISPNQGYRVDDKLLGPAAAAWVKFKVDVQSGHATEYTVTVDCPAGTPQDHLATDS